MQCQTSKMSYLQKNTEHLKLWLDKENKSFLSGENYEFIDHLAADGSHLPISFYWYIT